MHGASVSSWARCGSHLRLFNRIHLAGDGQAATGHRHLQTDEAPATALYGRSLEHDPTLSGHGLSCRDRVAIRVAASLRGEDPMDQRRHDQHRELRSARPCAVRKGRERCASLSHDTDRRRSARGRTKMRPSRGFLDKLASGPYIFDVRRSACIGTKTLTRAAIHQVKANLRMALTSAPLRRGLPFLDRHLGANG